MHDQAAVFKLGGTLMEETREVKWREWLGEEVKAGRVPTVLAEPVHDMMKQAFFAAWSVQDERIDHARRKLNEAWNYAW